MQTTFQRMAIACTNANGEADLVIVDIEFNNDDYKNGKHYDLAEEEAIKQGYEAPFVCFDEHEQQNIRRAYTQISN